jgi:6-phosphogluconolactonase
VLHPDGRHACLLHELDATVDLLAFDADRGTLEVLRTWPTLPHGSTVKPWAADIHITPDDKYLYTSERTHSTLSALKVDKASGGLTLVGTYPTEKQPRGFAITPDGKYLICAGEKSDRLSVFDIDAATGALKLNGRYPVGQDANWVEVVKF